MEVGFYLIQHLLTIVPGTSLQCLPVDTSVLGTRGNSKVSSQLSESALSTDTKELSFPMTRSTRIS